MVVFRVAFSADFSSNIIQLEEADAIPMKRFIRNCLLASRFVRCNFAIQDRVKRGCYSVQYEYADPKGRVIFQSLAVSWEIFPTDNPDAVINRVRVMGMTHFFVTDRSGRNFMHCSDMEDCYRIIEEQFPWVMLDGKRSDGMIEISHYSLTLTAPV